MMHRLFVYGTLLAGLCRHSVMQGAPLLGAAHTQGVLYDLGPYPAMVAGEARVHGELYEVSDAQLAQLDEVEAYDSQRPEASEYVRQQVTVWLSQGGSQLAWTYVYNRSVAQAHRIAHGDYRRHLKHTGYTPTW